MKYLSILIFSIVIVSCNTKNKYDVARYYDSAQQDAILANIITYIYIAPPYTLMKDRFKPEHKKFYLELTPKFSFDKFYTAEDDTIYFYVIRPGTKIGDNRGVGGYFKMNKNFELSDFREVFVTPVLPEAEIKTKGAFLFDKMVKGELDEYLKMKSYVQWPNPASYYDTTLYEWRLKDSL
ncbi:MAG: hypothetical protein ABI663_14745 [Chryseolinea sp.]